MKGVQIKDNRERKKVFSFSFFYLEGTQTT